MNKIGIILSCIALALGLALFLKKNTSSRTSSYTIGVLQTASHPALDGVYQGFTQELEKLLGSKVDIIFKNAQGSITDAHMIASRMKNNKKISAFFAIATPAAQALGALEKERPLVLAAVTHPESLGLIHEKTNVTGIRDVIDIPGTVSLIKELIPNAHKVALIYTNGDVNATLQADEMKEALRAANLEPLDFSIGNETDLPSRIQAATRKADVLLAPTDHMIANAIPVVSSLARQSKTPLFVSDNMLVKYGPLAARGVDYVQSGVLAAQMIGKLLTQPVHPWELPLTKPASDTIFINKATADQLGITIPENSASSAQFVE